MATGPSRHLTLAVVRSTDPATELIPIVRWLGQQRKIFNVHFRNIAGGLHSFREVEKKKSI